MLPITQNLPYILKLLKLLKLVHFRRNILLEIFFRSCLCVLLLARKTANNCTFVNRALRACVFYYYNNIYTLV